MTNEHTKQFIDYEVKINALIDRVEELSEMVEGKLLTFTQAYNKGYATGEYEFGANLKEDLLGELRKVRHDTPQVDWLKWENIESIINKLMP